MDIDAMHRKLADDEVLKNAREFSDAVDGLLCKYTWVAESVEDCHENLEAYHDEAAELLREVSETALQALNNIEDACADFRGAFEKLAQFAWPFPPRDIYRMAIVDTIHLHGGSSFAMYIPDTVQAMLGTEETVSPIALQRSRQQLEEEGLLAMDLPAGVWQLSEKGMEFARERAQNRMVGA